MLRFGTFLVVAVALSSALPNPTVNVFKPTITSEEAQQFLNSPPFTDPQLSSRSAVRPLTRYNDGSIRSADAGPTLDYYQKNGQETENSDDNSEEVYDKSQYNVQDGHGAYAYGYRTPQSAKQEERLRSGEVSGSYDFKDGSSNNLIKVRYWTDSEGFHQEDNRPKPQPVQETRAVKQARLTHEKAWNEAAGGGASNLQPWPLGYYPTHDYYQPAASAQQRVVVSPPEQEVYDTSRYHGQDGSGAYVHGYRTADSSQQEEKLRSGDVNGVYTFKAGNDLIKVHYSTASGGSNYVETLPAPGNVAPQPVQETQAVKQARLAHERAWNEAAGRGASNLQPWPLGYYPTNDYYQPAASAQQRVVVSPPQQAREGPTHGFFYSIKNRVSK